VTLLFAGFVLGPATPGLAALGAVAARRRPATELERTAGFDLVEVKSMSGEPGPDGETAIVTRDGGSAVEWGDRLPPEESADSCVDRAMAFRDASDGSVEVASARGAD
jgi:hypothetical protein